MKITKSMWQSNESEIRRLKANEGCDVCPCCGEVLSTFEYIKRGKMDKGILTGLYKSYSKGIFKMKYMRIDCYHCLTCDTEWESEPYEWVR